MEMQKGEIKIKITKKNMRMSEKILLWYGKYSYKSNLLYIKPRIKIDVFLKIKFLALYSSLA